MTQTLQTRIRKAFQSGIGLSGEHFEPDDDPDRIVIKKADGTMEFCKTFFYHSGREYSWRESVHISLSTLGVQFQIESSKEVWKPWPKESYYSVIVSFEEA